MRFKKGDSIQLTCTFTDASGSAIDLTAHTVKLIATDLYRSSEIFSKSVTTFSGSNNVAIINFTDAETLALPSSEGRYEVVLELQGGKTYSSGYKPIYISVNRVTKADVSDLKLNNDDIIVNIEDDIDVQPGNTDTAPNSITLSPANLTINEGVYSTPVEVATISANGTPTPSLTLSGVDTAGWSISGNKLRFTGTVNYEVKASYTFNINAENSENAGSPYQEEVTINAVDGENLADALQENDFDLMLMYDANTSSSYDNQNLSEGYSIEEFELI